MFLDNLRTFRFAELAVTNQVKKHKELQANAYRESHTFYNAAMALLMKISFLITLALKFTMALWLPHVL